jgi:hypothetical protein
MKPDAALRHTQDSIRRTLAAVEDYWKAHGYGPTYVDVKQILSFSSTSVVHRWLLRSWVAGYVTMEFGGRARTVRLTEKGRRFLEGEG